MLRVLGINGWIRWRCVKRTPRVVTWVLMFDGELEDFDVC